MRTQQAAFNLNTCAEQCEKLLNKVRKDMGPEVERHLLNYFPKICFFLQCPCV
jgi:hypothetical protein